jgi:hypothetical protein
VKRLCDCRNVVDSYQLRECLVSPATRVAADSRQGCARPGPSQRLLRACSGVRRAPGAVPFPFGGRPESSLVAGDAGPVSSTVSTQSAASRACTGMTMLQMAMVMRIWLWPMVSMTARGWTPPRPAVALGGRPHDRRADPGGRSSEGEHARGVEPVPFCMRPEKMGSQEEAVPDDQASADSAR